MVSKELRDQAISWFKKKYPKANIDKFEFGYNLKGEGTLKMRDVYYKITPKYKNWVLITDSRFLSNEEYKKDLYGPTINKEKIVSILNKDSGLSFPKVWQSGGSIQKIPKSNPLTDENILSMINILTILFLIIRLKISVFMLRKGIILCLNCHY